MNLQGQDWDTVVIRKKAPSGSAAKDKDAINAVRDRGNTTPWKPPTTTTTRWWKMHVTPDTKETMEDVERTEERK